jgi:ABC-2 type transport system permease protein
VTAAALRARRSGPGRHLRPTAAVVRRDLLLAWSYRLQFVAGIFSGFVSLAVFYYVSRLVRVEQFSPDSYFAFVAIGVVVFTVIGATLQVPQMALRQELVAGTFERLLLAPWGPVAAIASLMIYPTLYSLLTVASLVGIGAAVFDLQLQWATLPLALPVAVLCLLAFAPFGMLLLASVVFSKRAPPGANYLIAALSVVGGLYFPAELLPGWIQWASKAQPLTPAAELLRSVLVGEHLSEPAWLLVAKLAGFAAIAIPLTVLVLRRALTSSRRRGTILEY